MSIVSCILSLPGDQCNDSHMKSSCLHWLHISCLWWVNLKQVSPPSRSLSALQGNVKLWKAFLPGFNWRLTRLLTRVARETVAKGAWAAARPESQHAHRYIRAHAHIFLFLFASTYNDWVEDTLRQSQWGFGAILGTSNGLLSKIKSQETWRRRAA